MLRFGLLLLLFGAFSCGEKPDELRPYMSKLKELGHYNETLIRYEHYLTTAGMSHKAEDIAAVLRNYRSDLAAIEAPRDKRARALHNQMIRIMDNGLRKLVEPEFPTFVPNAQKSVHRVNGEMRKVIRNFELLWQKEGKTEPFPLSWPEANE